MNAMSAEETEQAVIYTWQYQKYCAQQNAHLKQLKPHLNYKSDSNCSDDITRTRVDTEHKNKRQGQRLSL